MNAFYPVLLSGGVEALSRFYTQSFGFEPTFETDWYVSLRRGTHELAILRFDHPTVPGEYRHAARGIILNVEVDDARAEYERLVTGSDARPVLELRDEDFGQRHFMVADPDGNLVDVIQNIAPSEEFAAAYTDGQG